MFDWDDEEIDDKISPFKTVPYESSDSRSYSSSYSVVFQLSNIIWGEAGESDDHIVPYPDQIEEKPSFLFDDSPKKERNQRTSNTSPLELKNPLTKAEHGVELDSNCKYDTGEPATGFDHTPWSDCPDPSSSSNVATAEPDPAGVTISKNITKSSESGSVIDEAAQFKKDTEMFDNTSQDGDQGDLVDYGWANIGSFDDLDRIFSNDDPVYGGMGVGHADELWSPSKDVTSSPLGTTPLSGDSSDPPFGALRASTDHSEVKAEYMLDTSQPFGYRKLNEITSQAPQDIQASLDIIEHFGGKSNLLGKEKTPATSKMTQACLAQLNDGTAAPTKFTGKANKQKRILKGQKLGKRSDVRQLHKISGTRSTFQQVSGQYAPSVIHPGPPLVLTQQSSLLRPDPFQQKYFSGAPLGTPLYGNMVNHYPVTPVLPEFRPGDENHELMSSSYEVPPSSSTLKKAGNAATNPPTMTPREKIEKLRRRQQMRAILAIQKQQLQFGNQVSVSENSSVEGGKSEVNESLGSFPSLEPNSPAEQYDSNTISLTVDNCSVEESVLYQLQDTIAKLDIQIRLCIRDSLSRLARSAMLRQYHSEISSTSTSSRNEVLSNKELTNHERFISMPDVETDTNSIDRVVAHLLFHRPLEFSGRPCDAPDSPLSASLPFEKKANPFAENSGNSQLTSPHGSKTAGMLSEGDQSNNCPVFVTPENVVVQAKVETSD